MVIYNNIDTELSVPDEQKISEWISDTIKEENHAEGDIAINLCTNDYIQKTNVQFLGHDYPTDIITFDYCEGGIISGDLLISVETVAYNAKEYNVSFEDELRRVIIHGVLHLCGYKDEIPEEQQEMRNKEDYYLKRYEI